MTPIDPTTPITVTLQAQEWNTVIGVLNEAGPHRVIAPLYAKVTDQVQTAAGQSPASFMNGADHHVGDRQ